MKRFAVLLVVLTALVGAAASPELRNAVAEKDVYRIENASPRLSFVRLEFPLDQKEVKPFTFGGEAKLRGPEDGQVHAFFRVDLEFTDGTRLEWVNLGARNSSDFRRYARSFTPPKPVKTATFYALFKGAGKAEFRNLFLAEDQPKPAVKPVPPGFAAGSEPEKLGKLKDFRRDLCLVTDLADACIIAPDTPYGAELAAQVNAALPKPVPVVPASAYDKALKLDRNLIVIGSRDTNTVVEHYYLLHKVLLDCYYPGKGGYTVRTLHDPFGDRHNVVFAGGSDEAGTRAAVAQLVKRIGECKGKLPYTADIKLADDLKVPFSANRVPLWEESNGYGSKGYFGWQSLSRNLMVYYMTGEKRYMDEFLRLAFKADKKELFALDDESHHNLDDPMLEPYHYRWVMTPVLWDLVEESPDLSEADRLRVTAKLYEMLKTRISKHYWFSIARAGLSRREFLPNRHLSWESVIVWATANYIDRHYDCYEGRQAMMLSTNLLWAVDHMPSMQTGSVFWYNTYIQPFFVYAAMAKGRNAVGLPVLRHLAEGLASIADLRPNDWSQHFSSEACLRLAAHLTQDRACYRLADLLGTPKVPFRAGWSFLTEKPYPRDFFRETSGRFFVHCADPRGAAWFTPPYPKDEVVEWLTWREKPEGTGDLLVLYPYPGYASREPFHNFALRTLRIDDDFLLNGFRTQLQLYADGMTPGEVAKYGHVTGKDVVSGDTVVIRGEVRNFNGFDWHRTIILRKNKFLVFWDEVKPLKPYQDIEIVNTVQPAGRVNARGAEFQLVPAPAPESGAKTLFTSVDPAEILRVNPHGPKPYLQGYVGFEGVTPGMVFRIPFVMPETAEARLALSVGCHMERRADFRVKLDGKTVLEKFHPITSDRAVVRVDLGKHRIASGRHLVTVEVLDTDRNFPATTILALGKFTVSRRLEAPKEHVWTVASSSTGRREFANGGMNFTTLAKGAETVRFATVLRPGAPDAKAPAAETLIDRHVRLRLPEWAEIHPTADGFEFLEAGRKTVIPRIGKITVERGAHGFSANIPVVARAGAETLRAPLRQARWEQKCGKEAICHVAPVVGGKLAVAQGNKVRLVNAQGIVERTYAVKALIGRVVYYAPKDLLLVASKDELLTAFDLETGKVRWEFTSEMAEGLVKTSAFYGFKSAVPGIGGLGVFELGGKPLVFAGSTSTLEILDLDGKLLKRDYHPGGGYVSGFAALPGRGILCIRHNSGTQVVYLQKPDLSSEALDMCYDTSGVHMGVYGFGSVCHNFIFVTELVKGGPRKIVSTFNGTMNRLGIWDSNGRIEREADFGSGFGKGGGYGAEPLGANNIRALAVTDMDGDGRKELVLAYDRRIVLVFTPELELRKLIRLPDRPCSMIVDGGTIVAGCFNGDLLWYDIDGKALGRAKLSGAVSSLCVSGEFVFAGSATGELAAFARK